MLSNIVGNYAERRVLKNDCFESGNVVTNYSEPVLLSKR